MSFLLFQDHTLGEMSFIKEKKYISILAPVFESEARATARYFSLGEILTSLIGVL